MLCMVLGAFLLLPNIDPDGVMKDVSQLRGRPFRTPVTVKHLKADDLEPFILDAVEDSYGNNFHGAERWLKALGLIDADCNLRSTLVELYKSQIAAFYNPKDHTYYSVHRGDAIDTMEPMIASHEFTHALQDQYMGLQRRIERLANNHDAQIALQSILEGEATIVMMRTQLRLLGVDDLTMFEKSLDLFAPTMLDIVGDYPPYLVHEMVFPYVRGAKFVLRAMKRTHSLTAMDRWWEAPPCTTEAIIHPELADQRPADFRGATALLPVTGMRVVYEDTLGESTWLFIFRQAMNETKAVEAAAGWDGDRISLVGRGNDSATVWLTRWDTLKDMREARQALTAYFEKRKMPHTFISSGRVLAATVGPDTLRTTLAAGISRHIQDWEVIDGYECPNP